MERVRWLLREDRRLDEDAHMESLVGWVSTSGIPENVLGGLHLEANDCSDQRILAQGHV